MIRNAISFVAVVKAGSFSKAAHVLGVSKAQLSRHVAQLEDTLQIQLLHRTTRTLTLTPSGEQFFLSCQDLEDNFQNSIEILRKDFHAISGTLRITAPIGFGTELLPAIISEFIQKYPHIQVVVALSSMTEDLIKENFDLAIRVAYELPDSTLHVRTLMGLQNVLCAAPAYLKNKKMPKVLKDLDQHACITHVNRSAQLAKPQWRFLVKNKSAHYTPNSIVAIDNLQAQIKLITLGVGIGRIPRLFVEKELKVGTLVEVLPHIEQPKLYAYLLYPDTKVLPKKTQIFLEFLKEHPLLKG